MLVLKSPSTLRSTLLPGSEMLLADAYLCDAIDVEGKMEPSLPCRPTLPKETWADRRNSRSGATF